MLTRKVACLCLLLVAVQCEEFFCNQNNAVTEITGEATGVITTLREGQSFYPNNELCTWVVDAGVGNSIKFTVNYVDLGWAPAYTTCTGYDNLEMTAGTAKEGTQLASICGRTKGGNPYHVISRGHKVHLQFWTTPQDFRNRRGVQLMFEVFSNTSCPPDWFARGEDCYMLGDSSTQVEWERGQVVCGYSQSNLINLESAEEYSFISDKAAEQTVEAAWVGLSDRGREGVFTWLGGSPLSYTQDIIENSDEKDCVAQDFSAGDWRVYPCENFNLNYICKRKKDGSTVVHSAFPNSAPPEDAGKPHAVVIAVAICVGVLGLLVIGVVVLVYWRRKNQHRGRKRRSHHRHSPVSSPENENVESQPSRVETSSQQEPSAPIADVDQIRSQLVAPPTYEESKHDPIVPALY